jgi:hypothetical protein
MTSLHFEKKGGIVLCVLTVLDVRRFMPIIDINVTEPTKVKSSKPKNKFSY